MATSLLALLDDIASLLDDVATFAKVATKKTAGVLGDDLALNAQQVSGVAADRELPVVWAVAKGSLRNKVILVPAALAISEFAAWAVTPLLMIGGAYLCYEGFEKIAHRFLHDEGEEEHRKQIARAVEDPTIDLVTVEKERIKGAVRTDFILSAEIVTITLGTVATAAFGIKLGVLAGIAVLMTVGVYGLVAGIVKLDDAGLYLMCRRGTDTLSRVSRALGRAIVRSAPYLMKTLSIAGTAAMFLVGGGILTHGLPGLNDWIHGLVVRASTIPVVGRLLEPLGSMLFDALAGIVAGAIVLASVALVQRAVRALRSRTSSPGRAE